MKLKKFGQLPGGVGFLICFCLSFGMIFILSLISAMILNSLEDSTAGIGIFSLGTIVISALLSGLISVRLHRGENIGYSAMVALAVVLVMLLVNLIMSGGKVRLGAFMNYACYMGSYLLGALIANHSGRRRKRR